MASNCELNIEPLNGAKIEAVPGGLPFLDGKLLVGELQFGQNRDILVKLDLSGREEQQKEAPLFNLTVKYYDFIQK